jgi:hypothetical protein
METTEYFTTELAEEAENSSFSLFTPPPLW